MSKLILAAAIIALTGCATNYAKMPPEAVARKVEVRDSAYDKFIAYNAPIARQDLNNGLFVSYADYRLAAKKDRSTGAFTYLLFVKVTYVDDWRHYESISLPGGDILPAQSADKKVDFCGMGCQLNESIQAEIPAADMAEWASNGVKVRLNSRTGKHVFLDLSKSYITGFIQATN